ncbi:MAG: discoidin domain-containing protein [Gemmatimonadetes bacterium]|nr:discoidin domain-containing protein [Gemmatimonadota bacterium]
MAGAPAPSGAPPQSAPLRRDPFEGADLTAKPPLAALSPAEEQARFLLPPGYRIEPILTEPAIQQPGAIAFDGNGRMFVLELRTYMLSADAADQLAPASRISRWEDRNDDGVYESHTVFVDSLVFPRFVTPFGADAVLTKESNTDEVWKYTDTNRDGVADRRELFTTSFGRLANVEHQEASLFWAMDNWMYSTVNSFRIRWTPNGVIREPTGSTNSQWGATQDDEGKVWFQGGASGLPSHYQFPIHYGNINVPNALEQGFDVPAGAPVRIADMQGGMGAVRMPDGSLNRVTAGAGSDVFRGHRLPAELRGDYFYGEPVARIVRRVRPSRTEGVTQLRNVYQAEQSEFIRSTDPLFRPVELQTAPDGTLYVVDMYHGIIQESQWTPPGSYLRAKIEQYQLDKIVHHGRIWRVTYQGMERDRTRPRMLEETAAQLVRHLAHPNGWWRDMAQQLLVLKQDRSVAPALRSMARSNPSLTGRYHALWTLEGLGALDAALVRELMNDPSAGMRVQAIRASETLYKAGDRSLAADYHRLAKDSDPDVVIQALLTLRVLRVPDVETTARNAQTANPARGVQIVAQHVLTAASSGGSPAGAPTAGTPQRAVWDRGLAVFQEQCSQCHGEEGRGTPSGNDLIAPALAGSPRVTGHPDYVIKTLLHGLTGPIEGQTYAGGVMISQGQQTDDWIAAVASYIRNSMTNQASYVTPSQVARVRAAHAGRTRPWEYRELTATVPVRMRAGSSWRYTASHNPDRAERAFDTSGWGTGTAQVPGMWYQFELPQPATLAEIQFDSPMQAGPPLPAGAPPRPSTTPRGYQVQLSIDGVSWGAPVAHGPGTPGTTIITFPPARARFVRITQTGTATDGAPWTMQLMRVFELPSAR